MKRPGIHVRLLLAVVILISATTSALGYIGVTIIHQFVQSRFEERIRFLARYLALNAELGILIDERTMLNRLAGNLLAEKDVIGVKITDRFGDLLADVGEAAGGPSESVIDAPVVLKTSRDESIAFQWPGVGEPDFRQIGSVRVAYSSREIDALLRTVKTRFLLLSVISAGAAMVIFFFISRSLVAPLTRLVGAVRKVADGDMEIRVTPGTLPETRKLALAFNAMLDSLAESSRALDAANREMVRQKTLAELGKFSLMIAHEVKNPLSIIKSSLDLLKKDVDPDSAGGATLVEYMEDEIRRLNRLIEDFLQFARPAKPQHREMDINRLLADHIERMRASNGGVTFKTDIPKTPCRVWGDPDLLIRAVANVVKNAADAVEGAGMVTVAATVDDQGWAMEISDGGPGIDPDDLPRIFEPFFHHPVERNRTRAGLCLPGDLRPRRCGHRPEPPRGRCLFSDRAAPYGRVGRRHSLRGHPCLKF